MKSIETMTLNELINVLNDYAGHSFCGECKIAKMNDNTHFAKLVEYHGCEKFYTKLSDSIALGEFNFEDEFFFCDSELGGKFFSFTTKEQLVKIIGFQSLQNIISEGVNLENVEICSE